MARFTIVVGILLDALGLGFYVATGSAHPTALIPVWFGLVLLVCGVLANTENTRQRAIWMHIAVTVGLLGFLATAIRAGGQWVRTTGAIAHPSAFWEQMAMAIICLLFVLACVRSFAAARRARNATA